MCQASQPQRNAEAKLRHQREAGASSFATPLARQDAAADRRHPQAHGLCCRAAEPPRNCGALFVRAAAAARGRRNPQVRVSGLSCGFGQVVKLGLPLRSTLATASLERRPGAPTGPRAPPSILQGCPVWPCCAACAPGGCACAGTWQGRAPGHERVSAFHSFMESVARETKATPPTRSGGLVPALRTMLQRPARPNCLPSTCAWIASPPCA